MSSQPKQPNAREVGTLFRADMVRAVIAAAEGDPDGKTETRRPFKINPYDGAFYTLDGWPHRSLDGESNRLYGVEEPYRARWRPGDLLWARETWRSVGWRPENGHLIEYRADERKLWREAPADIMSMDVVDHEHPDRWRPSIFLFRWAARVTMPVLSVRAERLTDITEAGVRAEGFIHAGLGSTPEDYCRVYREMHGLDANVTPWVWVIGWDPKLIKVSR